MPNTPVPVTAIVLSDCSEALRMLEQLPGYRCERLQDALSADTVFVDVTEAPTKEAFLAKYVAARELGWEVERAAHVGAVAALVEHKRQRQEYEADDDRGGYDESDNPSNGWCTDSDREDFARGT